MNVFFIFIKSHLTRFLEVYCITDYMTMLDRQ